MYQSEHSLVALLLLVAFYIFKSFTAGSSEILEIFWHALKLFFPILLYIIWEAGGCFGGSGHLPKWIKFKIHTYTIQIFLNAQSNKKIWKQIKPIDYQKVNSNICNIMLQNLKFCTRLNWYYLMFLHWGFFVTYWTYKCYNLHFHFFDIFHFSCTY